MQVVKHGKNVHDIIVDTKNFEIAMLSDIHWDNPKCDWDTLKRHLDYCLEKNIPIMINGDMFCLMQGQGDRRKNKSDIRPEHNNSKYLDSIVETAVEWWTPYAHLLTVIGYGNHETAIIKWQETDILQRFVDLLNYKCNSNVYTGGYGGWINIKLKDSSSTSAGNSVKVKYFHGSGGGGVVTKGAINLTRALELYEGFDVFTMGHIHENSSRNDVRDTLRQAGNKMVIQHKDLHLMLTGAYKEEYGDGDKGWHVERGAPIKPIGGRILTIDIVTRTKNGVQKVNKYIDSRKFNL
jgi:hypothetical protein